MDFGEMINIKVINVLVYVIDKKGNFICGLMKEDFILFEDGKFVNLMNFYEVFDGCRFGDEGELVEVDLFKVMELELICCWLQVLDDQMLYVIVYVDYFNIWLFNCNCVFCFVCEFLCKYVDCDDWVMLVFYNCSVKVEWLFMSDFQVIL